MKTNQTTRTVGIAMILGVSSGFALEPASPQHLFDKSATNVVGGKVTRTEARPVNTGKEQIGVQISNGRVLLVANGGRWIQNDVHVANIASLGESRSNTQALTTVVPHRFPGTPPSNLMPVSGDDWADRAKKAKTSKEVKPRPVPTQSRYYNAKPEPKAGVFSAIQAVIRRLFS